MLWRHFRATNARIDERQSIFEGLGANFGPPERDGSYYPGWTDIYSFVALESLLMLTAALLRHERWVLLRQLLRRTYIVRTDHNGPEAASYVVFDRWLKSIDEHRNSRLKLNRVSLSADMLKERCSPERTPFAELMQADVFLGLDAALHVGDQGDEYQVRFWAPRTAVYYPNSSHFRLHEGARLGLSCECEDGSWSASAAEMERRAEVAKARLDNFGGLSISRGLQSIQSGRGDQLARSRERLICTSGHRALIRDRPLTNDRLKVAPGRQRE